MCAHRNAGPVVESPPVTRALTWLGDAESRRSDRDDERSSYVTAGIVVLALVALSWLVTALALNGATQWPVVAVIAAACVVGVFVGSVSRAVASGPIRGLPSVVGRGAIAVAVGVLIGEWAATVVLSSAIDRQLDARAVQHAESAPAVVQADETLRQSRAARAGLDSAVEQALQRREDALVVARCEYNPSPNCPQVRITGDPGTGPETRTANEFLADAQRELDTALAQRNERTPQLDERIAGDEQTLAEARNAAATETGAGLGARWIAMNDETLSRPAALVLRVLVVGVAILLNLLPLILRLWRGETTEDRGVAAHVERERAELQADTSIGVKRAEVRAAVENLWAEQQLASARLAVEAQLEIEREQHRQRVIEARGPALQARSERVVDDLYLPIAAEAEAASLAYAEPPVFDVKPAGEETKNLPVQANSAPEPVKETGNPLMSVIPEVTKTATRWMRPFVPPIVASAIDTTTRPLRGVRQAFEETEEIQVWLKRTRKVSVEATETEWPAEAARDDSVDEQDWVASARPRPAGRESGGLSASSPRNAMSATKRRGELPERSGPRELPPRS